MTGYAPVSKKVSKGCVFQPHGIIDVFLKKGCLFILHRTLGVPRNKMLETLVQNAILGYFSQQHNTSDMPFRVKFCRSDAI